MQHADSYETTWVAPPAEEVYVEITTQSVVIDVLYGLDLPGLRITPDASGSCWVIEREGITPGEYTPWHTVPTRKEEARRLEEDEANLPIMVRALLAAERGMSQQERIEIERGKRR